MTECVAHSLVLLVLIECLSDRGDTFTYIRLIVHSLVRRKMDASSDGFFMFCIF